MKLYFVRVDGWHSKTAANEEVFQRALVQGRVWTKRSSAINSINQLKSAHKPKEHFHVCTCEVGDFVVEGQKQMTTINSWMLHKTGKGHWFLSGYVCNHEKHPDGAFIIQTSNITSFDKETMTCKMRSGSVYKLLGCAGHFHNIEAITDFGYDAEGNDTFVR